jgi:hypothetical protein
MPSWKKRGAREEVLVKRCGWRGAGEEVRAKRCR